MNRWSHGDTADTAYPAPAHSLGPSDTPWCGRPTRPLPVEAQWVGTGRTAGRCFPIPPVGTVRATFTAHGPRLRGLTMFSRAADMCWDAPAFAFSMVATPVPLKSWPCPMWLAFLPSEYYGHADSSSEHWRMS